MEQNCMDFEWEYCGSSHGFLVLERFLHGYKALSEEIPKSIRFTPVYRQGLY